MLKLAVFVSGRGSNLASIIAKIKSGYLNAKVCAVVSNKKECKAFEICKADKIPTYVISENETGDKTYDELIKIFNDEKIELIILAGFLKKIPIHFVRSFKNKIINIHPALLPAFGGIGMYGINVHQAVLNSGSKISGATIHLVDEIYDNGKIIEQRKIDISDAETAEEIAAKVLKVEHELLPDVIKKFVENKVKF